MGTLETQERIISSALLLFNNSGIDANSMRQIAIESDISPGNLHYHFGSKQEIIRCLFEDMCEAMQAKWTPRRERHDITELKTMFDEYIRLVWDYRFFFREMHLIFGRDAIIEKKYFDIRGRRILELEDYFQELVEIGQICAPQPPHSIRNLVILSWTFCDSWIWFNNSGGEQLKDQYIDEGFRHIEALMQPYVCG